MLIEYPTLINNLTYSDNINVIDVKLYKSGRSEKIFDVTLKEGKWPSDNELITLCDGGDPFKRNAGSLHHGGEVSKSSKTDEGYEYKEVKVFV